MKLSEWARRNGINPVTARRWFHSGVLPVSARQLSTGTIWVDESKEEPAEQLAAIYARVSSHDQKNDLERQAQRLVGFANNKGLAVSKVVTEIGSGLNGDRKKLLALLQDPQAKVLVVEHRDRLARFGFGMVEAALAAQGRKILVAEDGEVEDGLACDVMEVLTSFCARLYGRRSARSRAKAALEQAEKGAKGTV